MMMTIPKQFVETLGITPNVKLDLSVENGRLIVAPRTRPKYTLDELLAQCDFDAPMTEEDIDWLNDAPVGREII